MMALPEIIVDAGKGRSFANNVTFPIMKTDKLSSKSVLNLEEEVTSP
jgi:hypothetical protein